MAKWIAVYRINRKSSRSELAALFSKQEEAVDFANEFVDTDFHRSEIKIEHWVEANQDDIP